MLHVDSFHLQRLILKSIKGILNMYLYTYFTMNNSFPEIQLLYLSFAEKLPPKLIGSKKQPFYYLLMSTQCLEGLACFCSLWDHLGCFKWLGAAGMAQPWS